MPSPTENFSEISPLPQDQSDSVSRELRALSERPAPLATTQTASDLPAPTASPILDQRQAYQTNSNLPDVALRDSSPKSKEENRLGWLANDLLDVGLAGAAIFSAEAVGAVVFRSPKLAGMAIETAAGSSKLGLAAIETTAATSKFGFLTADKVLKSAAIVGGTYGSAIAARHYGYEALTGHEESWKESTGQFGKGLLYVMAARTLVKWSDKIWPTT